MSDAIEHLIVEPVLQSDVLYLDERTRAFFKRAGSEFPADAEWLFRPLHPGDYSAGLMFDAKGRKLEAGFGYTIVDGMLAIDEHITFPLEFAYMLDVAIDTTAPPFTWPLPGTQPGQGGAGGSWTIQPFPGNGGTWNPSPLIGPGSVPWSTTGGGVYYGTIDNSAQGVAQQSATYSTMNASPDMTITASYSNGPVTIADFATIRASGMSVTGVGTLQ